MTTKQEWSKNFETLMGRSPKPEEIEEAAEKGIFEVDKADEKAKQEWAENFEKLMGRSPNEKEFAEAEGNGLFKNALADDKDTSQELVTTEQEVIDTDGLDFPVNFKWYSDVNKDASRESLTVYTNTIVDDNQQLKIDFEDMKEIQASIEKEEGFWNIAGTEHQVDGNTGILGVINNFAGGYLGLGRSLIDRTKIIYDQDKIFGEYYKINVLANYKVENSDENVRLFFKGVKAETEDASVDDLVDVHKDTFLDLPITVKYSNSKTERCSFPQMVKFLEYVLTEFRKTEIAEKMALPNPYDGVWVCEQKLFDEEIKLIIKEGKLFYGENDEAPDVISDNGTFTYDSKDGRGSGKLKFIMTENGTRLQIQFDMFYGIELLENNRSKLSKKYRMMLKSSLIAEGTWNYEVDSNLDQISKSFADFIYSKQLYYKVPE